MVVRFPVTILANPSSLPPSLPLLLPLLTHLPIAFLPSLSNSPPFSPSSKILSQFSRIIRAKASPGSSPE